MTHATRFGINDANRGHELIWCDLWVYSGSEDKPSVSISIGGGPNSTTINMQTSRDTIQALRDAADKLESNWNKWDAICKVSQEEEVFGAESTD